MFILSKAIGQYVSIALNVSPSFHPANIMLRISQGIITNIVTDICTKKMYKNIYDSIFFNVSMNLQAKLSAEMGPKSAVTVQFTSGEVNLTKLTFSREVF